MNKVSHYIKSHLRILIVVALALVSTAVPYWIFLQIEESNSHSNEILESIQGVVEQKAKLEATRSLFEETKANRDKVETMFITQDGVVDLANTLEKFGQQVGVNTTIASLANTTVDSEKGINQVLANVKAEGTWSSMMKFVALVETLPLGFSFDQFSLTAESGALGKGQTERKWSLITTLRFYQDTK
jgi:Tfp pilus assembly protein PilO